jgi:undecaprenyl diphosphate synthase
MNRLRHLGIIMDGNGRWAQLRNHPRAFGHIKGARVAKKIITACVEKNVEYLTLYAFSTENWLRPQQEITFLMRLLRRYLERELTTLVRQNIRFKVIGDVSRLPREVMDTVNKTIIGTENCTGMNLIFALSYGSKAEIASAAQNLAQLAKAGDIDPRSIDEQVFSRFLNTYPNPDVDLIIRTSGEKRLSNFLLWQAAYAELYFTHTLWPDFTKKELDGILESYYSRERRFGRLELEKKNEELHY